MIEVAHLCKHYIVQGKRKTIFDNLSFKINSGERIAFMGKNGVGKSTLLRLLCGIEKPNRGTIHLTSSLSWPVGVADNLIPNLTGKENVKFVCRLFGIKGLSVKEKIDYVKSFSEIGHYFDLPVQTYSSGMRSRLAFALSMAFDFDFYIVDEAFAVGDVRYKQKCQEAFAEKAERKGIIMVSHSISIIREFCDRGILFQEGKITESQDVEEIINLYASQE
ncbi:ABC transporter ATP-binding protein [Legionella impletisoli]|uniref:ABC transporter ATP-binding protein n=1 Tax=Legionella impletisoli TaxID=343510 RepID=A0A917NA81_9GAMM|nr:ABC transporter ATP-binding protein [Legionella impletisoli]GGI77217.1 ABC transporter ATP-binding protein [Legionella impletisoli]